MSDREQERHDEIARALGEQGPVKAPPDLAGEVMRRVRDEPRRSTSAVRRPLLSLLAASLITIALVAGISKLGGGSSGSASGGTSAPEAASSGGAKTGGSPAIERVPLSALQRLAGSLTSSGAPNGPSSYCPASRLHRRYTLSVPYDVWDSVRQRFENARQQATGEAPRVTVQLRRLPPGAPANVRLTCP